MADGVMCAIRRRNWLYALGRPNGDLDVTCNIVVRTSGLVLQVPGHDEIPLMPVFPAFYGSVVDLVKCSSAGGRPPTAFTMNRASVRNLRVERIPWESPRIAALAFATACR
jgi:hypothetical protein